MVGFGLLAVAAQATVEIENQKKKKTQGALFEIASLVLVR